MSEPERQLKLARKVIEVALNWIDKAEQTIRRESGKTERRSATKSITKVSKSEDSDA